VPSATWGDDLMVPGRCEMIIDARSSAQCASQVEGPFGEFPGTLAARLRWIIDVRPYPPQDAIDQGHLRRPWPDDWVIGRDPQ